MPRADFYILPQAESKARVRFLLRLLDRILDRGLKIHLHLPDSQAASWLDRLLWEFRPDSFIPHAVVGEGPAHPVSIGYDSLLPDHREVFVNLCPALPDSALAFERVVEIVIQQPEMLEASRRHYRLCQQAGYEIRLNDMRRR